MITVKRPRLLDDNLAEAAPIHALSLALSLKTPGVSTATLVIGPDDPEPPLHAWIELYTQNGSVGVYRVTSPVTDYAQNNSLTLRHGIDSMADSVLEAQEEYSGTPAALLSRIMAAQTARVQGVAPWTLGTCEATADIKLSINYTPLNELLSSIETELEDYIFEYDQSSFPWVLNVRARPTMADSELRMNRNITTISRTINDKELCTQLILSINHEVTSQDGSSSVQTIVKTYDDLAAQQDFGVVQKTADIDTGDDLTGQNPLTPEADAWAARFLRDHGAPSVQIQVTGRELKRVTGDSWDELRLGHICCVPIPKYNHIFNERAVEIDYPDALGQPDVFTVSLANQLPKFSNSIANLRKDANRLARSARSAGRSAASKKDLLYWEQKVRYYGAALDGTGVTTLYESGIEMTPDSGVKIYNLEEGIQSLYAGIEVNRRNITLKVSNGDVATQLAVECGNVSITGGNLVVDGYVTSDGLAADIAALNLVTVEDLRANRSITADNTYTNYLEVNDDIEVGGSVNAQNGVFDSIELNGTAFTNCIVSASVSGDTLTLTPLVGNPITFRKAAQVQISGHWSGRRYIVTATPSQLNTPVGIVYDGLVPTGSISKSGKSVSRDYIVYSDDGEGNADSIIMQKTVTISASSVYDDGYYNGRPTSGTAGGRTSGVTALVHDFTIGRAEGDAVVLPIDCTSIYTAARSGYTLGTFTPATVTPQGASETAYVEGASGGTDYYEADLAQYYYPGNGGAFTVQGESAGTIYKRKTSGSIRITSTTVHTRGTPIYFKSHPKTETPTGLWYSMVGSASGATTYYTDGGDKTYYESSSSGTYYYLGDGTDTTLYKAGTETKYDRGTGVYVTPIKASSKKHLVSDTCYKAGTPDSSTYYTKS